MTFDKIIANNRSVTRHQWLRNFLVFLESVELRILNALNGKAKRAHVLCPQVATAAARILVHDHVCRIVWRGNVALRIVRDRASDARQKKTRGGRHSKS